MSYSQIPEGIPGDSPWEYGEKMSPTMHSSNNVKKSGDLSSNWEKRQKLQPYQQLISTIPVLGKTLQSSAKPYYRYYFRAEKNVGFGRVFVPLEWVLRFPREAFGPSGCDLGTPNFPSGNAKLNLGQRNPPKTHIFLGL
jgi:hypothetical protein